MRNAFPVARLSVAFTRARLAVTSSAAGLTALFGFDRYRRGHAGSPLRAGAASFAALPVVP